MKNLRRLLVSVSLVLLALNMQAGDTGWEVGAVASKSVTASHSDEPNYLSYGAGTAFRWQLPLPLPVKLFLRPELSLQCLRYHYMEYISFDNSVHANSNFFSGDLGLGIGVNFYKNLSFYTGPQFRYAFADKDSPFRFELHNKVSSYWTFGLYLQIFKAYACLKYCQHLNKGERWEGGGSADMNKPCYSNKFELSIGYRF